MAKPPPKKKDSTPSTDVVSDSLAEAIDVQIGDLVPQGSRKEVVSRISHILLSENFSGPIAHPRHLREYETISPGAADRIIAMAERQQDHHISMDHKVLGAEVDDRKLGMWLGAGTFALLIICATCTALFTDSEVVPGLFLGAAALGGVALFIKGRSGNNGNNR